MMTQEIIHPADSNQNVTPATSIRSKVGRRRTDWGDISITMKPYPPRVHSAKVMGCPERRCTPLQHASHRWAIVLAGGNGHRMRDAGKTDWGNDCPKPFGPIAGKRTLLEETRQRAERSVPPEQILYSVTQEHERYYRASLADRSAQTIVRPSNKGTAPAILSGLIHIVRRDPSAIVAILPCDHSYSPENAFTAALDSALLTSEQQTRFVVFLGLDPKSPESDSGWIEVGETVSGHPGFLRVKGLQEEPSSPVAQTLFRAGSLWNTFVMVGHVCTFLEMAWAAVPDLLQELESRRLVSFPHGEIQIPSAVYDRITPTDFARQVLCLATDRLLALRLKDVEWSDGEPAYRELTTLFEATGELPSWVRLWPNVTARTSAATV